MMLAAFEHPVFESQATFRELLQAMARPAQPRTLPALPPSPPPIAPAVMAVLLTLCDADVTLWLQQADAQALHYLRFHTGVKIVPDHAQADFALVTVPEAMPALDTFSLGDPYYPDRSTSLIVQVPAMHVGEGDRFSGPGIEHEQRLAIEGLPASFWQQRAALTSRSPLGLDMYFADTTQVAALPRTTHRLES